MITQLLPVTPPGRNGLADYARKLRQHWPEDSETWSAVALDVPEGAEAAWRGVAVSQIVPTAEALAEALPAGAGETVILHYVSYAYCASGAPAWLVEGLEAWKRATSASLFVVVHEAYVWAKPWRRAYAAVRPSKAVFRRLARIADAWVTSSERYFREAVAEGADAATGGIVPIGSNIEVVGIRSATAPGSGLRLIVFGLAASRVRAMRGHRRLLKRLAEADLVQSLHIVGSTADAGEQAKIMGAIPGRLKAITVEVLDASEAEISAALSLADVGLCAAEPLIATKSGVYAAFCAHGVVPVVNGAFSAAEHPPFIANDDRHAAATVRILADPDRILELRRQVLEWSATVGSWDVIAREIQRRVEVINGTFGALGSKPAATR